MIKLSGLAHSFGETQLDYPDWEIAQGEHALILGNSGSGKTTLLHLCAGLLKASSGKINMAGEEITSMSSRTLDKFRGRHVGLVFQKPHLLKALSVQENIIMALKLAKKEISKRRVAEVLDLLNITSLKNRKVHQISEGQSQRVSIARAVIHEPMILAADEPTASLDDENCERVISLLKSQAERCKATLIIATHDQRLKDSFNQKLLLS